MIEIFPEIKYEFPCLNCGTQLIHNTIHWQGVHVCTDSACPNCKKEFLVDLPVNQASVLFRLLDKNTRVIFDENKKEVSEGETNWFNSKLLSILEPSDFDVKFSVEIIENYEEILILNTVDFVYGHSLLLLLNLQRLLKNLPNNIGLVILIQPMMKWLLPATGIAEIWTVDLKFNELDKYYTSLSTKINSELKRFKSCYLSKGYVLPTDENIIIENFTKIKPYSFNKNPNFKPRITFIWRQDPGRIWLRNIYIVKGLKYLGFKTILLPFQYLKVRLFFYFLSKKLKNYNYRITLAGFGKYGYFPSYIDDKRVSGFTKKEEIDSCTTYSESELVIGVHGSSILLPSSLAGMTVSMMPSKRWGNFAEDILFNGTDARLAIFERRIIPLNISLFEIIDICLNMLLGRETFVKKFIHTNVDL